MLEAFTTSMYARFSSMQYTSRSSTSPPLSFGSALYCAFPAVSFDASAASDLPVWDVPLVYWTAVPRELIVADLTELAEHAEELGLWVDPDPAEYPDGVHDDDEIDVEFDVSAHLAAKTAALACHRTQLTVKGDCWVLASGRGMRIQDREWFIRVKGGRRRTAGYESELLPQQPTTEPEGR